MTLLKVESLVKSFKIEHLQRVIDVFDRLSFSVDSGEFLLVSGRNGVGKSSLLRCLYRTYIATGGHAWYQSRRGTLDLLAAADVDIALLRREELGFVTQFLRPRPRVSALELVMEPLLDKQVNKDTAQEQAEALFVEFGLKPELWNAYPTTFSGGEQQKVNLARALISPRRLLLLDEPTASLDRQTRQSLVRRLAELKRQGTTMIGVFHHPEDVHHLVDQVVELNAPVYVSNNGAHDDVDR